MTVQRFTFNPFQTNCFVCHDDRTAVIVDPSNSTPREHDEVLGYLEERGLQADRILLTHAHIDHIFGCAPLSEALGIPIYMHRDDAALLKNASQQAALFGSDIEQPPSPEGYLTAGEAISVPGGTWHVLHTPGHSPGSVSFYDQDAGLVLSGDVLFAGSIGRTDLWQGSLPVLMQSIYSQLVPLGDSVTVMPGHGPQTTVGHEVRTNPFLNGDY